MQQTIINGYRVMIFSGYDGTQLFVNHPDGQNIYAHRVSGDAMARAREIIALDMPVQTASAPTVDPMICLSDRKSEFRTAMKRGLDNDLQVFPDFDKDTFIVVNRTNGTQYEVRFETRADRKNYVFCGCKDFQFKKRLCKHAAEVLQDTFFGVVESFGVTLNG